MNYTKKSTKLRPIQPETTREAELYFRLDAKLYWWKRLNLLTLLLLLVGLAAGIHYKMDTDAKIEKMQYGVSDILERMVE